MKNYKSINYKFHKLEQLFLMFQIKISSISQNIYL